MMAGAPDGASVDGGPAHSGDFVLTSTGGGQPVNCALRGEVGVEDEHGHPERGEGERADPDPEAVEPEQER